MRDSYVTLTTKEGLIPDCSLRVQSSLKYMAVLLDKGEHFYPWVLAGYRKQVVWNGLL